MPYTDFTLEATEARFDLVTVPGDLFPGLIPLPVPEWLRDVLARGQAVAALVSEKARSEFLVTPMLLACRDLVSGDLCIYSGQRLDVDADLGLTGECDFILALTQPVPRLRAPLLPYGGPGAGGEARRHRVGPGPVCRPDGGGAAVQRTRRFPGGD